MSDNKPPEPTTNLPVPQEGSTALVGVAESLAALRALAKSVRSFEEWKAVGRKATPEEIALAETQREPNHCIAHSVRTGLPCEGMKLTGTEVCRVHGASAPQVKKKHQQALVEMLPKAERALNELLDQTDHLPSRLNAVKEVHDRALGPLRQTTHDGPTVQVNIGFALTTHEPQATTVDVIDVTPDVEDE